MSVVKASEPRDAYSACARCRRDLTGHRFIIHEQNSFCVACYETQFSPSCAKCKTLIGIEAKDLTYKGKHWHEACFVCSECNENLFQKMFAFMDNKLFCSACFEQRNAIFCEGCKMPFKPGSTKFDFNDKHWHEKCFACIDCDALIGNRPFIPVKDRPVCMRCYERNHAQRCSKCFGVITSGGLLHHDRPWHRECFVCTNCERCLADEKFKTHEDRPYCLDCSVALFSRRCALCAKPIGGVTGANYLSYNQRDWHVECFKCLRCGISLMGRGFMTNGEDIMCKRCAEAVKTYYNAQQPGA